MFVRQFGDNFKFYLRGQGIIKKLGIAINTCFIFFLVYSFVFMNVLHLGILGYGLSLFIYEVSSMCCSLYFFIFKMNRRARDNSHFIFNNIGWLYL